MEESSAKLLAEIYGIDLEEALDIISKEQNQMSENEWYHRMKYRLCL